MFDRIAQVKGEVSIFPMENPKRILYHRKNVIVNGVSFLFARLFSNSADPVAGVWGLAVGAGGTSANGWSASQQPDPTPVQTAMVSEIKRKALAQVQYLDATNNDTPTTTMTTKVGFLTVLNGTTDDITVPIREMGLIGGGTTQSSEGGPTNMLTAPYFDPTNPQANTVTLINYITQPSFLLPAGVDMGILWKLTF